MSQFDELKDRVSAKQHRLEARLAELRADVRAKGREEGDRLETELKSVRDSIKDGWESVTEEVAAKLNQWLDNDNTTEAQAPSAPSGRNKPAHA